MSQQPRVPAQPSAPQLLDRSAQEHQLQQVLENIPDAILICDRGWNFIFANQQAIDLLGSGPLIGENLWELFPGNTAEPFFSSYTRTMEQRQPTEFEAYYPAPLNTWFRASARPYLDSGIIIFFTDIAVRKQAEFARDRNAALVKQVLEATSDGVLSLDTSYRITYFNRHALALVDAHTELYGRTLWEVFPRTVGTESERNYRRTMEQRVPSSFVAFYPEPLQAWFDVNVQPSEDGITLFFRDITAAHLASEALREQQALLAFVQQSSGVATWNLDLRTRSITYGPGSAAVFGHPLEQLDSVDAMRPIIHPESLRNHPSLPELASTPDHTSLREYRLIAADGTARWVESRSRAVFVDGRATHLRGAAIDITARKRNDEALRESERRYRVLADLNPQALWTGSPEGQVTYANQGFLDYLGFEPGQLDRWPSRVDSLDRGRVLDAWADAVRHGTAYDIEARLLRHDGASRWWRLRALPVRNDANQITQWLGVATDIDDSRTFAETLRLQQLETERQRAELESIYENTPVGLGLFDPVDFRYLRLNDELARIIGLPKDQILGRTISEITSAEVVPELFQRAAAGVPVRNHILRATFRHDPSHTRSVNLNYLPVYDRDGHLTAISAASLDITQQQRTEAALMQSEKLAAVGRLASSISHEINNPLEAITNLLYLVAQHDGLPDDLQVYVHMAQSELARVSQIATQTLRFHRQAVKPTLVTPAQLVNAVLTLYQGRLANSAIRPDVRYNSHTPILCFENDIRQVLNNLIANAIDAMRNGGRLIVRAHDGIDHPTGRTGVRIVIADTGHGMSRDTMARVFEPFFTTKDLNGTGLGLWISKDIVDRHQGRLTVRSTQETDRKGTIFSLFLPQSETGPA